MEEKSRMGSCLGLAAGSEFGLLKNLRFGNEEEAS